MTKILIVKTSSMGDVLHTLPALTDAAKHVPNVSFNWVVEPAFAEIPTWHPHVHEVICVPFRKFRKTPMALLKNGIVTEFFNTLRQENYDYIIDAQGLMKSALITAFAKGLRCGLNRKSAWEPLATLVYRKKVAVNPKLHAITRMRQLFSKILEYPLEDNSAPEYGLQINLPTKLEEQKYLLFIHGTTWKTKEWPEQYWQELAAIAVQNQYEVLLPWGNTEEQNRAARIKDNLKGVTVLPKTTLTELAGLIETAQGIVSVDTGLGHLAAALSIPTVSLYGPTDPIEIGTVGRNQTHLAANFKCAPCWKEKCGYQTNAEVDPPCFGTLPPTRVWQQLKKVMQFET